MGGSIIRKGFGFGFRVENSVSFLFLFPLFVDVRHRRGEEKERNSQEGFTLIPQSSHIGNFIGNLSQLVHFVMKNQRMNA